MKKVIQSILAVSVCMFGFAMVAAPVVHAQFTTQNQYQDPTQGDNTENLAIIGAGTGQQDSFVNVIKGAINWVLGILALIALIILLYGGFRMVTAAGDEEQYNSGFTILKQAAVGLAMIGIAWFIVSIIFWLVSLFTTSATPAGTGG